MSNFVWQIYSTVKWIMLAFQWLLTTKSDGKMADISMGHDITVVSTSIWYLLQWGCTVFEIVYTAQFYRTLTTVYLFGIKKSLAFVHRPFCTFKIQIQTQHFGDWFCLLRFYYHHGAIDKVQRLNDPNIYCYLHTPWQIFINRLS